MPIKTKHPVNLISERDFHEIDYQITRLAFDIHNEMGRLWDEKIYQNALANRCRKAGFSNVDTEVPVSVSYQDFVKEYYVDLLVEDSIMYELKTAARLNSEHEKQALHYLFLLGMQHGKLINFRPESVEKRFVSTSLLPGDRYNIKWDYERWQELDADSRWLKSFMEDLLKDWGAFLATELFYDAVCYFRGSEVQVIREIDVVYDGMKLGNQKVHLLNPQVAFKITAITKKVESYRKHLHRFTRFTKLKAIQWINFNHQLISFETIENE